MPKLSLFLKALVIVEHFGCLFKYCRLILQEAVISGGSWGMIDDLVIHEQDKGVRTISGF